MIEEKQNRCLECGKEIYGRTDKKYCNTSCKNSWHNRLRLPQSRAREHTLSALDSNYEILGRLLLVGITSVDMETLQEMGFKQMYMTGHRRTKAGHNECRCFDICYCMTDRKIFKLCRIDPSIPGLELL